MNFSVTMDMDWACDGVLADTMDLVDSLGIPVTMFVTHDTPMLQRLREDPLFTLGIHPNFLPHLCGQSGKSFRETIEDLMKIVPEAKVVRCHAIIDATPILTAAKELGFEADYNLFIPFSSGITLKPFRHFSGIMRIPYFYEDDAWALEEGAASPEAHLAADGLKVFNFHPIHLYLNTESMERYQRAKAYYHDFPALKPFVNQGGSMGARDFLQALAKHAE